MSSTGPAIGDCAGLAHARAVWDFTTADARRFRDRLELVIDAVEQFAQQGIGADFVILLHGGATQFAARTLAGTRFEPQDLSGAHAVLQRLVGLGGRVEVCRIAMDRSAIAPENILDGIAIEHNVFVNAIALQNRGYAYLPIA
jgi:intracellular sulfur oxidation DsrE/DsrF family protein